MTLTQIIVAAMTGLCVGGAAALVLAWLRELSIAPLPIHVTVTQQDIENGIVAHYADCSVAHAIRRALPAAKSVKVAQYERDEYIEIDGERYEAPLEVLQWLDAFDTGLEVKPFEFYLFQTATD